MLHKITRRLKKFGKRFRFAHYRFKSINLPRDQYPHTVVIHTKGSGNRSPTIRPSYRACLPLVTLQSARPCRFAQSGHSIMAELSVHPVSPHPPSTHPLSIRGKGGWLFSWFLRRCREWTSAVCARGFSNLICIAGRRPLPVFPFVLALEISFTRRARIAAYNSYGSRGIRGSHDALPRSRGINQAYLY